MKAAANADAELREKGLLSEAAREKKSPEKPDEVSVADQIKRAQIIDEINSSEFVQKEFISSSQWGENKTEVNPSSTSVNAVVTVPSDVNFKVDDSWKTNPEILAHPKLFEDPEAKMKKWVTKLAAIRQKKLNGIAVH